MTGRFRNGDRKLAEELVALFSRTGRLFANAVSTVLEARNEPLLEWRLLWCLVNADANTQRDIAHFTALDPGSVSRALDDLESRGLVRRQRDESDRRKLRVEPTVRGRARIERMRGAVAEAIEGVLAGLSRDDRLALKSLLEKVLARPTKHTRRGAARSRTSLLLGTRP